MYVERTGYTLDHTQNTHTHTHTLTDTHSVGLLWTRDRPDNTQHSKETDIRAPGGIWTCSPSKLSASDLLFRPRGYWDQPLLCMSKELDIHSTKHKTHTHTLTDTHSVGLLWTRDRPDNTQHSKETDIRAPGGIWTCNPSKLSAADLLFRPRDLWDQPLLCMYVEWNGYLCSRLGLKRDGIRAETRFCLSAKRTSPFKSAGAQFQSTTGSQVVRISGINAGYTMFRVSVKGTGYPLRSPVSPLLPLPCGAVCHHISPGLY